jgi:hypothetical protein
MVKANTMVRMTLVARWTEYNNRAWVRLGSMVSVNRRLQLGLVSWCVVVEVLRQDFLGPLVRHPIHKDRVKYFIEKKPTGVSPTLVHKSCDWYFWATTPKHHSLTLSK